MKKESPQSVTNAILDQKLITLTQAVQDGFKGIHDRQDTTNGKVLKSQADIQTIQQEMAVRTATQKLTGSYEKVLWFAITSLVGLVTFFLTKY